MLDSYIIEEIKRQQRERDAEWDRARPRVQPHVPQPVAPDPEPELPADPVPTVIEIDPEAEKLTGVVHIDLS